MSKGVYQNNYLKEVRLGSAVIKTFLGFLAGGDL
jgi:hypothetical protein